MQALSHYTYHMTGGAVALCDLQGGMQGENVVLTDPVIMSNTLSYGAPDLGRAGAFELLCPAQTHM